MVLLVVDAQKLITVPELYRFDEFESNVKLLIGEARKNGVEVVYICHDDGKGKPLTKGTDGFEIYEGFAPQGDERIFDKTVNSPFRDSGLAEYLESIGETELIVTGLQTDYCIDATVKCGFERGFHMIVPSYANTTFDNRFMSARDSYEYYNEFMWKNRYAECVSVEETVERMSKKGK